MSDMKCASGKHVWTDPVSRERCCNPLWIRITIIPGERMRNVLADPLVAKDGWHRSPDGFGAAWMRVERGPADE
jgi:hypothetical protein